MISFFKKPTEKSTPTILGAGTRMIGEIHNQHILQVHGIVDGNIVADTVIIGKTGLVHGKIIAKHLFLHGTVDGPATVEEATIFPGASISGDLHYFKLNIINNENLECRLIKRTTKTPKDLTQTKQPAKRK